MKTLHTVIISSILFFGFTSFIHTKTDLYPPGKTVYVVGWDGDFAMLWQNGEAIKLSDKKYKRAYASGIFVKGKDVYISGCEGQYAVYWLNGIPHYLNDGSKSAFAMAICVDGKDVYVTGDELDELFYVAKYWKNGVVYNLDQPNYFTDAYSIYAYRGKVVVVGNEQRSNSPTKAKYWLNGQPSYLPTEGSYNSTAYSAFIYKSDFYIAGDEIINGVVSIAKYWKNGKAVNLTDGKTDAHARCVFVTGNDVYIGGEEEKTHTVVAQYWKNGVAHTLTKDDENIEEATVNEIFVSDGIVYAVGLMQKKGENPVAMLWEDGKAIPLTDASMHAGATSVFVK